MKKVLIIGGGPAGMMAAIIAARNGHQVEIYEKNKKLGKKLFITGKGRCNLTNASDIDIVLSQIITNPKFLYSAIYTFSNQSTIEFFNQLGLKTKIERGNRVFPVSDKSSDVIKVLEKEMQHQNIKINYEQEIDDLIINGHSFIGLKLINNKVIKGDAVIIATGGLSYPSTGSTGDGFTFAKKIGHTIIPTFPSLVPINIKEDYIKKLQGLSLKNVNVSFIYKDKIIYEDFGEMLFTHFGVSGPTILSGSRFIIPYIRKGKNIKLSIDLKPALDKISLDKRLIKDFNRYEKKQFKNALDDLLPKKLIPVIISLSGIPDNKKVANLTKEDRNSLITLLKNFTCHINSSRSYNEAIITNGGINVKEINPHTMESKLVKGIYFAGEILDLDALTGGYNLQIAWSTGYLAGINV
ncbi:MAG: NAD(P)/FAD-dependent oxidoreductase [Eubacteriales bacterium]